ncbi:cell division cycle-associated protein 3 [Asbolus verrucosus]|uniref:Cell division cycle-associated protein 3 n=1 Tax=Asbolus verrucosus TaxID=1661398 RepID=A0A482W4P6_ASBVE|nr:cell division cycle-associated protein 3 [Asbolus verrucosus]
MGGQESKPEPPSQAREFKESAFNDSVPSTPILTPQDPRSPSVNIARTPLELVLGAKTSEGSANMMDKSCEGVVENVVLGIDPRSPTVEFNRTPIIVSVASKENPPKLQNKNLDNVRKSLIQTTPLTRKSPNIVPPKLLDSSPISAIPITNKRKSLVGLLETNIDYTETDLDSVYKAKEAEQLKYEMDALHIEEAQNLVEEEKKECMDDNDKTAEDKTINVTAQVKDFDKKLTNLIYQDESEDDDKLNLKFTKIRENNRTPLGIRNSNEEPKKAVARLRVSDKPRKTEISKIPVFKDNHGRKIGIQCENTPPRQMEEKRIKPKVPHWDGDKTLII